MTGISAVRAALVGAGLLAAAVGTAAPAQAQYVGYPYGYPYAYRPYYVPYYRPRVLFVPPPVVVPTRPLAVVVPTRPLAVGVPRAVPPRRVVRARAVPPPLVCPVPGESPFAGPGAEGIVPASAAAAPFVAPIPGVPMPVPIPVPMPAPAPRARPGVGDLPSAAPATPTAPDGADGFRGD